MSEPTLEWRPEAIIAWAARRFQGRLIVSSSFGNPEGTALLHMVARTAPGLPVVWVNTGFLFPETVAFQETLARHLGLRVVELAPSLSPEKQAEQYGPALWARDPDLCCQLRKVEPLFNYLQGYDAWMTAIRRGQTAARAQVQVLEEHRLPPAGGSGVGKTITKINPLAAWSREQVWRYLESHQVPYHPLLDQGYTSLGCIHCTRRVAAAAHRGDDRSGRWWGQEKTECGLHTRTVLVRPGTCASAGPVIPGSHPGRA